MGRPKPVPRLQGCPSNPVQMRGVPPPHEKSSAVMRVRYHVSGFRGPGPAILAHGSVKPVAPRSIVTAAASAIPLIMMKMSRLGGWCSRNAASI